MKGPLADRAASSTASRGKAPGLPGFFPSGQVSNDRGWWYRGYIEDAWGSYVLLCSQWPALFRGYIGDISQITDNQMENITGQ